MLSLMYWMLLSRTASDADLAMVHPAFPFHVLDLEDNRLLGVGAEVLENSIGVVFGHPLVEEPVDYRHSSVAGGLNDRIRRCVALCLALALLRHQLLRRHSVVGLV